MTVSKILLVLGLATLLGACGDDKADLKVDCDGGDCPGAGRDLSISLPGTDAALAQPNGRDAQMADEPDGLSFVDGSMPPDADRPPATCPSRGNGVCDEPSAGGECPVGSDPEDCRGGACQSAIDCPADEFCQDGVCVPTQPAGCQNDTQCPAGQVCNLDSGACEAAPTMGCQRSADCPPGEVCDVASGQCGGAAPSGCQVDADCGLNAFCDASTGACIPLGGGGGDCIDDTDCAFDEFCDPDLGLCIPAGGGGGAGCLDDSDCPAGQLCDAIAGECFGGGAECLQDADCGAGFICFDGFCLDNGGGGGGGGGLEGDLCTAQNPNCDFGLSCVGSNGFGSCRPDCNAALANDCGRGSLCVPVGPCDANQGYCQGFCFPDDECVPQDSQRICGADAYCDILMHASACIPAGPGAEGDPCIAPGAQGCQAGLACIYGTCTAPCDAAGACAGGATCVDFSAAFGANLNLCLTDVCDPFDANSCGRLRVCELLDETGNGPLGRCNADLVAGRGIQGDVCQTAADNNWGTCNAAHVCGYPDPNQQWGDQICQALCDAAHPDVCPEGSACAEGLFPLPGMGLCFGECDPASAHPTCDAGITCRPRGVAPLGQGEVLAGVCSDVTGRLPLYEDCNQRFDGSSDCLPSTTCSDAEGQFDDRCLPICDGDAGDAAATHPCGAEAHCQAGGFDTLDGNGTSTIWGVCVRANPAPRCPLPPGGPMPVEICNNVDDDCDGLTDNGANGDRQLDCPAGQSCFGGQCF